MEHILPVAEVPFLHRGRRYMAHCVPDEFGMGALQVCLHEVYRGGGTRFIGYGAFGKRFVSDHPDRALRGKANAALEGALKR